MQKLSRREKVSMTAVKLCQAGFIQEEVKTILYLTSTDKQMGELLAFLQEKERTMSEIRKEVNRIAD